MRKKGKNENKKKTKKARAVMFFVLFLLIFSQIKHKYNKKCKQIIGKIIVGWRLTPKNVRI